MSGAPPRFWEVVPLDEMSKEQWESLCDGCGKCCLNKIEYEDTGEVDYTRIACKLLDGASCRCIHYETRHDYVPDCVKLTPENLPNICYWMPRSCAYRLLFEGRPLPAWHPLISNDPDSPHRAGVSMRGLTVSEENIHEDDWDAYIIEEKS